MREADGPGDPATAGVTVPAALAGERVDRVVAILTGLSRGEVAALVDAGSVLVGGTPVNTRSRRVGEGDVIDVTDLPAVGPAADMVADPEVEVPVVYEDEWIVVVDKPSGLVVHPGAGHATGTLVHGLLASHPEVRGVGEDPARPGIVHRLDAGTSGLLVVARRPDAFEALVGQLAARSVDRVYDTVVDGAISEPGGLVDGPIGRDPSEPTRMRVVAGGRPARTRYRVEDRHARHTRLECRLETGRTHQIRVHLAGIGHPVAADSLYGGRPLGRLGRPYLHARHLAFVHPGNGERVAFDSPRPADLVEADAQL